MQVVGDNEGWYSGYPETSRRRSDGRGLEPIKNSEERRKHMAQYQRSYAQGQPTSSAGGGEISGWAVGFTFFASTIMMLVGSFHLIAGFAAVLNDAFYVVRPGYDLKVDVTTWGWIQMGLGTLIVAAGIALMVGALWARIVAILMAVISGIWAFYSIPYYPVFSILIIALNIGVVWALTVHGRDIAEDQW
jgi:hypothetical protein